MASPQELKENILEVSLVPDHNEPEDGRIHLKVNLTIDGVNPLRNQDDDFDIIELTKSETQDGIYFHWTCSCGDSGCAGYMDGVEVKNYGDFTIWSDKDQEKTYKFKTEALKAELHALRAAVEQWSLHARSSHTPLQISPILSMDYLLSTLGIY